MPRSPRRKSFYVSGIESTLELHKLPHPVAQQVAQARKEEMRVRHKQEREKIAAELRRVEVQMKSDAFSADIRRRLSKIRTQLKKKSTKKVRFAA